MPYYGPEDEVRAERERAYGLARQGVVRLRDFHEGVVKTLGAKLLPLPEKGPNNKHYFLLLDGIDCSDAGLPGIPIFFSYPEDVFEKYKIPLVMIRFDGMDPAMDRWHPGMVTYRVPARGATQVAGNPSRFNRYEIQQQAPPYDLNYTVVIEARHRGIKGGQKNQALLILQHVLSIYQPYTSIDVVDSVGDTRSYYAETSGVTPEDEVFDVADRTIGFSIPLRVTGELDAREAREVAAVTQPLGINLGQL